MNPFEQFLHAPTIDILEWFDRDQAIAAGYDKAKVNEWAKLQEIYFGPTQQRRQQEKARDKAQRSKLNLDQLAMLERRLRTIKDKRARDKLRIQLLSARGTYRALADRAKALIPQAQRKATPKVTFSKSRDKLRTVTFTADEHELADLEHECTSGLDPNRPAMPQMVKRLLAVLRGGGVGRAVRRPMILVPLNEHVRILAGQGDDTILGLSDGTTITGAEYLAAQHGKDLEVGLFHPQEGPVNLYRTKRLANQKQRDLARLVMPVCPVPDCRHGSEACELHHITSWQSGGETNLSNLAPLCRYHNRVNDDDPSRNKRGRIENINGTPTWVSPNGYPVPNRYHPFGAMRQLFGTAKT